MITHEIKRAYARGCNGIRICYIESGSGSPIVMLHGFPDFSYSWRHQFPALTSAGFHCIAPDMRGYNETDKPPRVKDYDIDELVKDVDEFIQQVAGASAFVIGHDWGGIVAWHLAARMPARVRKLVIINSPHPVRYQRELRRADQLLRAWYAAFFQLPAIPELVLSSFHFRMLVQAAARTPADEEIYEEAFSQPGALHSALNYYRAAFRRMLRGGSRSAMPVITQPTLVLWGEQDGALTPRLLEGLDRHVANLQIMRFPDVGHWVHIDAADRVNEELMRFLK